MAIFYDYKIYLINFYFLTIKFLIVMGGNFIIFQ
jgi:hypothetical protein